RAGAEIYHAGCIGEDGQLLYDIIQNSGVKLDYLNRVNAKNGHAIIQLDKNAQNCIIIYKGTNGMLSKEYIDGVLDNFSKGDILMLQNEVNNISYIIDRAHSIGMQTVFNPSPFTEELKKIDLNKILYLVLNEVEAKGFFKTDNINEISEQIKTVYPELKVVLTLGAKGCAFADETGVLSCPAFKVKAVDTTAAGDTFTGYFVTSVAKGIEYSAALKIASAASALAVSKMGAAPSIPTIDEVKTALENLEPQKNF
ncbi:MAG: ribokinase, partial [Clostridia bacterium]|nr:ribokinase [Clostridia bacterium]